MRETSSQEQKFALRVIASQDLADSSFPSRMWRPRMRRTNRSSCQQTYCSGEQELVIRKPLRQKSFPHAPPQGSCEKLIDCIFMSGFSQPELSDTLLPVIYHRKRGSIYRPSFEHDSERKYPWSVLRSPPPNPLQCTMKGRSGMEASSCQTSSSEKAHCAHFPGRSSEVKVSDSLAEIPV